MDINKILKVLLLSYQTKSILTYIYGICPEERRRFRNWAATAYRFAFWAGSFHYIRMRGRQATREEAPILVAASHSTFADTLVIYLKGPPASVAKAEAASYPLIGSTFLLFCLRGSLISGKTVFINCVFIE